MPVSKIIEIAGLEGTGKSYLAGQIACNAQKIGIMPVIFDSESALDQDFLQKMGCDLNDLLYVEAVSVEKVLEIIENLLETKRRYLFIWDSLANCPSTSDLEGSFDPNQSVAVKARILSKGFAKLNIPIYQKQCTLLILNQLKTQITPPDGASPLQKFWTIDQKYTTPGGKSTVYNYSLRIWLTSPKNKSAFVFDDKGFKIGSSVKATIIKSRFGSQGRSCEFKILWAGDRIGILDDESLISAIQSSDHFSFKEVNSILKFADGKELEFKTEKFGELMRTNPLFKQRVMELVDEEVIIKFDKRSVNASVYFDNIEETDDSDETMTVA